MKSTTQGSSRVARQVALLNKGRSRKKAKKTRQVKPSKGSPASTQPPTVVEQMIRSIRARRTQQAVHLLEGEHTKGKQTSKLGERGDKRARRLAKLRQKAMDAQHRVLQALERKH